MNNNYIESFIKHIQIEKKYSINTCKSYRLDLIQFFNFISESYGNINELEITKNNLRDYIFYLNQNNKNTLTINRKIISIKQFYSFLFRANNISKNPVKDIKTLKSEKKIQIPFSEKEMKDVFEIDFKEKNDFIKYRNILIIDILYQTGIRKQELINIKISDINKAEKTLKIISKSNKERFIFISDGLLESIENYIKFRNEKFGLNFDYLILSIKGKKINEKVVYLIVNSYLSSVISKAKKSPHMLRHTFATHLLNSGADINSVKDLLNHKSLSSTQIYVHSTIEKLKIMFNQSHPRGKKN